MLISKTDSYGKVATIDDSEYEFIEYHNVIPGVDEFYDYDCQWRKSNSPANTVIYRRKKIDAQNIINVSREQFKQVYNIVCQDWKDKLRSKYSQFTLVDDLNILTIQIEEFLKEADDIQEAKIRKILKLEKEPAAIGDLVFVKNGSEWLLRYYAGNMTCFNNQKKSGPVSEWITIIKFDLNKLPF